MGLDLSFNKQQALAAGLIITLETNGNQDMIEAAIINNDDPDYIQWLKSDVYVMHVPTTDIKVDISIGYGLIIVRANKWGRVYEPLTDWLKAKNINWEEY